MKYFLDCVFYPCEGKFDGRPWALFVRAGNDGTGAISSICRILRGLAVREVQKPLLIKGEFGAAKLAECEEFGLTVATGLEAGVFSHSAKVKLMLTAPKRAQDLRALPAPSGNSRACQ